MLKYHHENPIVAKKQIRVILESNVKASLRKGLSWAEKRRKAMENKAPRAKDPAIRRKS